jgi:DNA-directed RNA polymerase specialized sigma24 family protein
MTDSELRAALELHHSENYGWALNCCARSSVDAEAVLQTVYLKVLMGKARYHGKASFKTWLFAVIRRTTADERGRKIDGPKGATRRAPLQVFLKSSPNAIPVGHGDEDTPHPLGHP